MHKKDYYEVLNLTPNCTFQDVKKNYHKLALTWHPDKHINKSEAECKFTEINEAYTILGDAKKRKIYDACGHQGLLLDQEMQEFTSCNAKDFFSQKNFQGTNKSAFEVLRDIFEENDDDDDFFGNYNPFDLSGDIRSHFKSFIDETLLSSENEDDCFFKKYTPTFMDSSFFGSPPRFPSNNGSQRDCKSSHSEFFSFFSSMNSDMQSFSRTSTTIRNKGKVKTSTKQKVHQGGKVYENEETIEYLESTLSDHRQGNELNCKRPPKYKNEQMHDVVIIDDDDIASFNNVNISCPSKKKQGNSKTECRSQNIKKNKNNCKMFEINDLADDECDIFNGSGLKFTHGVCKKNKK